MSPLDVPFGLVLAIGGVVGLAAPFVIAAALDLIERWRR